MLKRIQTYIEQEPWDEAMLRQERLLNRAIVVVMILSAIYLVPPVVAIFLR